MMRKYKVLHIVSLFASVHIFKRISGRPLITLRSKIDPPSVTRIFLTLLFFKNFDPYVPKIFFRLRQADPLCTFTVTLIFLTLRFFRKFLTPSPLRFFGNFWVLVPKSCAWGRASCPCVYQYYWPLLCPQEVWGMCIQTAQSIKF